MHHDDVRLQSSIPTECLYNSALTQIPRLALGGVSGSLKVGYFLSHTCLLRLLLNLMALPGTTNVSVKIIFLTKCSTQEAILRYFSEHLYISVFGGGEKNDASKKEIYTMALIIIHFFSLDTSAGISWRHALRDKIVTRLF